MCGIFGFYSQNEISDNYIDKLKEVTLKLSHRGPDSHSLYINDKLAIGHYRLSIIDLEGGIQPKIDKEKNHYLLYNGEIYGYKKQAKILRDQGVILRDNSDTEVLFQSLKISRKA